MLKFSAPLAAMAVMFAHSAMADTLTPITVELSYDSTALASEKGARSELASLRSQARTACTAPATFFSPPRVDEICVEDVLGAAISQIVSERESAGLETAAPILKRAVRQTASLEQR
ncbi:MAG: UrcA family protein [Pseudomonadota bacterium]